jgi:hypothetical protein
MPGLMHAPWIGAAFGKNRDEVSELRMVVVATPRVHRRGGSVADAAAWAQGQNTQQPLNNEFYFRGYMEVPRCDPPADQAGYQGAHPRSRPPPVGYITRRLERPPMDWTSRREL